MRERRSKMEILIQLVDTLTPRQKHKSGNRRVSPSTSVMRSPCCIPALLPDDFRSNPTTTTPPPHPGCTSRKRSPMGSNGLMEMTQDTLTAKRWCNDRQEIMSCCNRLGIMSWNTRDDAMGVITCVVVMLVMAEVARLSQPVRSQPVHIMDE